MTRKNLPAITCIIFCLTLLTGWGGSVHAQDMKDKPHWTTPNAFLQRGTPTIIFGTGGLDESDARLRTEARFIRDTLFPKAQLLPDTAVNLAGGPQAWPDNPIIYGGPHVNRVMQALRDDLPFKLGPGYLNIGELDLAGSDEYGLIAVIPGNNIYPEFLLYAGTGTPGVGGINSVWHGSEPILVTDRFGRFASGTYTGPRDKPIVFFPEQSPTRLAWQKIRKTPQTAGERTGTAYLYFTQDVPPSKLREDIATAVTNGASKVLKRLGMTTAQDIHIYLYTDPRTKGAVTNNTGNGHSTVMANALHLVMIDPRMEGPIEDLTAHEATHVYAYQEWGPPGSSLMGEGLAVWAAEGYARKSLQEYASTMPAPPPATALMGGGFSSLPEQQSYPLAGLFVEAAIATVGKEKFLRYLYPATLSTWKSACRRAGTTPETIQDAFAARFSR